MKFVLLAAFVWLTNVQHPSTSRAMSLEDAIQNKQIAVTVTGNSSSTHYLKPLLCEITNLTNHELSITVPPGYHFASKDVDIQDVVTTQEQILAIHPSEKGTHELSGMCIQHQNVAPSTEDGFMFSGQANTNLLKMAQYLDEHNIQSCQGQQAMWAVADNGPIEPLYYDNLEQSRALINATSDILGRPHLTEAQFKTLQEGGVRTIPKAELKGKFSFKFSRKVPIHIALFDENGIVLKEIYRKVASAGRHNVEYTFDALPYQGQTIHAKLIAFNDVLLDRVIDL